MEGSGKRRKRQHRINAEDGIGTCITIIQHLAIHSDNDTNTHATGSEYFLLADPREGAHRGQ